jgi:hypothetical protein
MHLARLLSDGAIDNRLFILSRNYGNEERKVCKSHDYHVTAVTK